MEQIIEKRKKENWDLIKERYPDSFVLLLNPEYTSDSRLKAGIFVYKHKIKKVVYQKAADFQLPYITVKYTGGKRLEELDENTLIL